MKKLLFIALIACSFNAVSYAAKEVKFVSYENLLEWKKAKMQTWAGKFEGKEYWYKLDKMAKLWWSTDGKKWAEVENGMWADKEGKWLKIHEGKLVWTADGGKNWAEVPDWKWEGSNGVWYKFDAKWKLWENR